MLNPLFSATRKDWGRNKLQVKDEEESVSCHRMIYGYWLCYFVSNNNQSWEIPKELGLTIKGMRRKWLLEEQVQEKDMRRDMREFNTRWILKNQHQRQDNPHEMPRKETRRQVSYPSKVWNEGKDGIIRFDSKIKSCREKRWDRKEESSEALKENKKYQ